MLTRVRPFRHAASVILASNFPRSAPGAFASQNGSDTPNLLSILTVKRKPSASFMPSAVVFPGGEIDEADFSNDYALAYKRVFQSERKLRGLPSSDDDWLRHVSDVEKVGFPKVPAYEVLREAELSSRMPPEWAFRVCALRELFEECGILIGYCLDSGRYLVLDSIKNISESDNSAWDNGRRRVRDSAEQFETFSVQELGIVPAFWLLDEWSNWLAPSTVKQRSRFDTLFYSLCLDEMPAAVVYEEELEAGEWANPNEILANEAKGRVILAPPQVYEISRLANFSSVDQLREFSIRRRCQGLIRFFPLLLQTADERIVSLLPGDDLYPSAMDESASDVPMKKMQETAAQLRSNCENLHRAEFDFVDGHYRNAKTFITVPPLCGHVAPIIL